jgi:hypothetical protein
MAIGSQTLMLIAMRTLREHGARRQQLTSVADPNEMKTAAIMAIMRMLASNADNGGAQRDNAMRHGVTA